MSYLTDTYRFVAPIPPQTLCEGSPPESNEGIGEINYKQIPNCTVGNTLVSCSIDFYNLDDTNLKFGAYSDNGSNVPDQLLASGEVTNQTISNTYTTLTLTFTGSPDVVPADGKIWVAIIANKSSITTSMRANVIGGTPVYTTSAYANDSYGEWENYANNLYTTAPFVAYGGNNWKMCVTA